MAAVDELRSIMQESERSSRTHERAAPRLPALAKSQADCFEEMMLRVVAVKRKEPGVERVMRFLGQAAALDEPFVEQLLKFVVRASGAATVTVRTRACELGAAVLRNVDTVDDGVFESLVDAMVPRATDAIVAVRAAACGVLARLADDDEAREALVAACRDPSAEVRRAAVGAIEATEFTLDALVERCRDVDAAVRVAAYDALARQVDARRMKDAPRVLRAGLEDRDAAVRESAIQLAVAWLVALQTLESFVSAACGCDDDVALAAVRAVHRRDDVVTLMQARLTSDPAAALACRALLAALDDVEPPDFRDVCRLVAEAPPDVARQALHIGSLCIDKRLVDANAKALLRDAVVGVKDPALAEAAAKLARRCFDDDLGAALDAFQLDELTPWTLAIATALVAVASKVDIEARLTAIETSIWLPAVSSADVESRRLGIIGLGRRLVNGTNKVWATSLGPLLWRVVSNVLEETAVRCAAVRALADASMVLSLGPETRNAWNLVAATVRDADADVAGVAAEAAAKLILRFGGGEDDALTDLLCTLVAFSQATNSSTRAQQVLAAFFPGCAAKHPASLLRCADRFPDRYVEDEWFRTTALSDAPKLKAALVALSGLDARLPCALAYAICRATLETGDDATVDLCAALSCLPCPTDPRETALVRAVAQRCAQVQRSKLAAKGAAALVDKCGPATDDSDPAADPADLIGRFPLDDEEDRPTRRARSTRVAVSYREETNDDKYFAELRRP